MVAVLDRDAASQYTVSKTIYTHVQNALCHLQLLCGLQKERTAAAGGLVHAVLQLLPWLLTQHLQL